MKKLLFSILALFLVQLSEAQRPIIIKGKIDNCTNRDISYIEKHWFNTKSLQEESKNFDFSIADDGTFQVKITESDDYYVRYWIHLGDEFTHLDLIAGDSIYMTLNGISFDESIKYTGSGAGRNNYRRDVFLTFWDPNADSRVYNKSDINQFLSSLDNLTERKQELLNKYYSSGEIDSSYYQFEKTMILNDQANLVLKHNERFQNHKYADSSESAKLRSIIDAADYSDDHFLQYSNFRELITRLPGYKADSYSGRKDEVLKNKIAFATAHYSRTMNLYFDLAFIRNSIATTESTSKKKALLAFFANQFPEPVLKNEIHQQMSDIHRTDMRSGVIETTMIVTSILIGLIASLFIIFWLIRTITIKPGRIDLALWLKVGFYLIVFFIALAYISESQNGAKALVSLLLWLGVFLVHTYLLIPKYTSKSIKVRYFQALGAAFILCVAGVTLSDQNINTTMLVLAGSFVFGAIILLSWTSYYIAVLASRKSTLKGLVKSGELDLELAVHLVLVFMINFVFLAGLNHPVAFFQILPFYAVILLFYYHTFVSFPRFFNKEKAIVFVGINLAILLIASFVMIVYEAFQLSHAFTELGIHKGLFNFFSLENIRPDFLILFVTILIPSFIYYYVKERFKNLETTGFSLYRKKEAELAQLRSQVNPHFLFNTLNTLYAFALKEGSEKTAECIAKLANLMRFMLDDMEKETIPLQREVSYIQDYIKLQSIRSAVEHDIVITIDIEPEKSYSIAPMLLIPFVENAFKHGMNPNKESQLRIDISAKSDRIQFVIENSTDENFEAYYKEKGFGIGIENVKSRLMHIYPNRHNISIAKPNGKFIVILTVDLL